MLRRSFGSYRLTQLDRIDAAPENGGIRKAPKPRQHPWGFEWPSLLVALAVYGGFLVLTWNYHALPWWLVLPLGGYLVAWHGSLQHEVVHGHPTGKPFLDELIVYPSLWLWLPFHIYRQSHLAHHDNSQLTDPLSDPESFYLSQAEWQASSGLKRRLLAAHNSALGRLLLGPPVAVLRLLHGEAGRLRRGDFTHLGAWLWHLPAVVVVLVWVLGVCEIPLGAYLLLFVYPGLALTLLRSFLEHQAARDVAERTAIVESGPLLSLMFLNNNLHAVHHGAPALPWYRLPKVWRHRRDQILAANGGYHYRSYWQVLRRHFLTPKEPVLHPLARQAGSG